MTAETNNIIDSITMIEKLEKQHNLKWTKQCAIPLTKKNICPPKRQIFKNHDYKNEQD